MQKTYSAFHPLCRKFLKMRIWRVPLAGGQLQAGGTPQILIFKTLLYFFLKNNSKPQILDEYGFEHILRNDRAKKIRKSLSEICVNLDCNSCLAEINVRFCFDPPLTAQIAVRLLFQSSEAEKLRL